MHDSPCDFSWSTDDINHFNLFFTNLFFHSLLLSVCMCGLCVALWRCVRQRAIFVHSKYTNIFKERDNKSPRSSWQDETSRSASRSARHVCVTTTAWQSHAVTLPSCGITSSAEIDMPAGSIQFFNSFHTEQYNLYWFSSYLSHQ